MKCTIWEPLLSGCIDGTVSEQERAAVSAHVYGCASCRVLMQDLEAVRLVARQLEPLAPPPRVWHRLADTVLDRERRREFGTGWLTWRLVASVAMLMVVFTGLSRVASLLQPVEVSLRLSSQSDVGAADLSPTPEADYTVAIARLEQVTTTDSGALDPETADAINAGMTVIDRAITESRAALRSEPDSQPAQDSLFEALRRKLALLQDTIALINDMRQGDQNGAARILSEMNK